MHNLCGWSSTDHILSLWPKNKRLYPFQHEINTNYTKKNPFSFQHHSGQFISVIRMYG